MKIKLLASILLLSLFCVGCRSSNDHDLNVHISYSPPDSVIGNLTSPFDPLSPTEKRQDWGKEIMIGRALGQEQDLYRAITAFKRALILAPPAEFSRRLQIEYDIALSYYLGKKYRKVIEIFENSKLLNVTTTFPAFETLLIVLYDSYQQVCETDKALRVLTLIDNYYPETARDLKLSTALSEGYVEESEELAACHPSSTCITPFIDDYYSQAKSVNTARFLSAILPGSGYLYVGQQRSALTSFLLNGLFIWATIHFFDHGHTAAGIITAGFETGWYIGGIHGARNAAKRYNECLWKDRARTVLFREKLHPVLMFHHAF